MSSLLSPSARTSAYRIVPFCKGFVDHRIAVVLARTPPCRAAQ